MRGYRPGGLDDFVAYHGLPEVARFQFWETRGRSDLIEKIAQWAPRTQITSDCDTLAWVVETRGTSRVIGDVFLALRDREARQCEIGYSFNSEFQGRNFKAGISRKGLCERSGARSCLGRFRNARPPPDLRALRCTQSQLVEVAKVRAFAEKRISGNTPSSRANGMKSSIMRSWKMSGAQFPDKRQVCHQSKPCTPGVPENRGLSSVPWLICLSSHFQVLNGSHTRVDPLGSPLI